MDAFAGVRGHLKPQTKDARVEHRFTHELSVFIQESGIVDGA